MMSFAGVPAFYIHSFTATPNYHEGVALTKHNRTINRRKWELNQLLDLLSSDTPQQMVFNTLKERILLRKQQLAFHPGAKQEILALGNHLFGLIRECAEQKIMVVANLTPQKKEFKAPKELGFDLISNNVFSANELEP